MVVAMSYDTALGNVFTSLKVEIVLIIIFVVVLYIALNLAKRQQQKNEYLGRIKWYKFPSVWT